MAYTHTDLDNVEAAIAAIVAGERVVSVTIDGETVQYQQTEVTKLMAVRRDIMAEIQASSTNQKSIYYTQTGKGL
jgi:hypothetical protein